MSRLETALAQAQADVLAGLLSGAGAGWLMAGIAAARADLRSLNLYHSATITPSAITVGNDKSPAAVMSACPCVATAIALTRLSLRLC